MRFLKLKELCEFEKGSTSLAKAEPGDYPLVTTGAERKSCNTYQFDSKAVCIPLVSSTGHGHASLKNVHYQEGKFALGSILVALTSKDDSRLDIQFLHLYLSQLKDQVLVPLMSGAANVALSVKKIQNIEIPLPPIGRQREIVERFKSIVAEEDELKSELTHQQTLLKKLRQQILQEAIEGKLTADWRAQNPDVEPASELLKRIATEKAQLIKDKKIKKGKKQPPSESFTNEIRYPEEWELPDLDDISIHITDGTHQTPTYTSSGRIFLSAQNVKPFRFMPEVHKYVSEEAYQEYIKNRAVEKGDLVLGRVGEGIGETAVVDVDIECAIYVSLGLVKTFKMHTDSDYLAIVFNSPYGVSYAKGNISSGGGSAGNFNLGRIRSFPIPLPSLEEQKVIVTKVENLLVLCDQLESQITQNQTHAEELMQAVLKEAFGHNSEAAPTAKESKVSGGASEVICA